MVTTFFKLMFSNLNYLKPVIGMSSWFALRLIIIIMFLKIIIVGYSDHPFEERSLPVFYAVKPGDFSLYCLG
mgnify:CR=1 FL=1